MSGGGDRFADAATALGFEPEVRRFPQGTKTAEDAARAIGCDVDQIVKSLVFLTAEGEAVMALTSGRHRVDEARLAALAGTTGLRRATPEDARAASGFSIGGTPPFGHPQPVRTWADRTLDEYDIVWAAGGTPDSVFPIAPPELVRLAGAPWADFAESPSQG